MSKEAQELERQLKELEKQFEAWKQQNQNHPDKEAFAQYEKQWQDWRAQLVQKREQMANAVATQPIMAASVAGAATSSTGIQQQIPSYMHIQPYMYGATTAVAPVGAVLTAVVPPTVIPPVFMPPSTMPTTTLAQMTYNVALSVNLDYGNQNNLPLPGSQRNEPVNYNQMSKEAQELERQLKELEKQFEAWKQQNQNHPDKEAFAQYEKQWQDWRAQLVQKREQMANAVATQPIMAASVAGAATSSTGIQQQIPSYMHIQPYMYGATTAVAPVGAVLTAVVPPTVIPPVFMPPSAMPTTTLAQMTYNVALSVNLDYGNQNNLPLPGSQRNEPVNYMHTPKSAPVFEIQIDGNKLIVTVKENLSNNMNPSANNHEIPDTEKMEVEESA